MRFEILCLFVLAMAYASAQVAPAKKEDGRIFIGTASYSFTTFTVVKYTTTTTSTFTSVTTCTTSTTTLSTCTPSGGRRRRGLFYNSDDKQARARRGLFYDEDENDENEGSIFLPAAADDNKSGDPVNEVPSKALSGQTVIPLEVQSGVSLPTGYENSRFLVALGTTTVTNLVVTTSTSSLTAICSSTTGFAVCASAGKR